MSTKKIHPLAFEITYTQESNPHVECKALYNENPLIINTEIATALGLYEAIIIQQIHYWLEMNKKAKKHETHFKEERWWTYNSINEWQKNNFPFMSIDILKRTFKKLVDGKILLVANYNPDPRDRTNWYSLNYFELNMAMHNALVQNPPMDDINNLDNDLNNSETFKNPEFEGKLGQSHVNSSEQCPPANPQTTPLVQNPPMHSSKIHQCISAKSTNVYITENTTENTNREREESSSLSEEEFILNILEKVRGNFQNSDEDILISVRKCQAYHKERWREKVEVWLLNEKGLTKVSKKSTEYVDPLKAIESIIDEEDKKLRLKLKQAFGEPIYKSWFNHLKLFEKNLHKWIFEVPTNFIKEWIELNYKTSIISLLRTLNPTIEEIEIVIAKKIA